MIGNRSLIDNAEVAHTLAPAAYTDAGNGTTVDLSGSTAWMFLVSIGVWTDGTHTIVFEDSDDNSTWGTVDADDLDGYDIDGTQRLATGGQTLTITDATKNGAIYMVAYVGGKRYLRARRTASGTTDGAIYSVSVWKLGLRYAGHNPMRTGWTASDNTP